MSFARQFHLKAGEKLRLELRRHLATFFPQIILLIVATGVPIIGVGLFFGGAPAFDNVWARLGFVLLGSAYYLSFWLFFFTQVVNFYLDVSIITDRRVIDVMQVGLFNCSISELELARVQDVTSEVHGFFGTLLDYGKITVQTASEQEHFIFDQVPHPHRAREIILQLAQKEREHEGKEIVSEAITQNE